jgi:hypothetical protein
MNSQKVVSPLGTSQVSWKKRFSFQDLETRYFWRVKSADYEYSSMSLQNIFLHKKNQVTLLTPFSLVEPTLKNIFIKNCSQKKKEVYRTPPGKVL